MTLNERIEIEIRLKENESIRNIAKKLNKSPSTILREINKRKIVLKNNKILELRKYKEEEIMNNHPCNILKETPYLCNGCIRYLNNNCNYHYIIYKGEKANDDYRVLKSNSNKLKSKLELKCEISKYLRLGQPITHIYLSLKEKYNEKMVSITTIYNWINSGKIIYKKKERVKKNIEKEKLEYKKRIDFLKDREYKDFLEYIKENKSNIVEMDLLCGKKGTNGYILTIFIPKIQFLLAYKLKYKSVKEVIKVLDNIENKIGFNLFKKLFGIILTDRGSEFLRYEEICFSKRKLKQRCKIFYCDAGKPTQKAYIENIHKLIRKVFPKKKSLEMVSQEDLYEVVSNINSLKKKRYNSKSPNDMFVNIYGINLLKKLSLRTYEQDEVVLLEYNNF